MMSGVSIGTLLLCLMTVPAVAGAQAAPQQPALTYRAAQAAADAAEAEARRNNWDVTIVVSDVEGVPLYLKRMDGASSRSYEVAIRKAKTAVATGLTTAVYGQRVAAGQVEEIPDGITFAGGVPIVRGGEVIGAVAASGVRAIDDEQISQAGADAAVEER